MARRIFISYQHKDQMKAKGFNLLRWNKNVSVEFVGRHLLDPVKSKDPSYIRKKIAEMISGTSVTVVLVGKETHQSKWVAEEIERSLSKDGPNGILAIKLDRNAPLPKGSPLADLLRNIGAEVIDWHPADFAGAIERAAQAAKRAKRLKSLTDPGSSCGR